MFINYEMATIEITKAEAKEAGVFKSEMYENLKEAREATGYKVVVKDTKRKADTMKGLTYAYMTIYIEKKAGDRKEALMTEFNELRGCVNGKRDPVVLDEYCDFMEEYLQQGLLEKQVEHMQRNQYTQLLQKKIKTDMNFHSCLCLADNLMKLKDYSGVQQILDVIDKKWHRREEYWVRKIQLFAEQKNGRAIQAALKQMKEEHIYLSSKSKEVLAFWLDS